VKLRRVNRFIGFLIIGCLAFQVTPLWAQSGSTFPKTRPALYEFGAGYCLSCKEMAKIMAELQAQYGDQLEVRMVYADQDKDLFLKYKVVLIPTQVFLDASGQEVERHMGALSKEEVLKKLKDLKCIR